MLYETLNDLIRHRKKSSQKGIFFIENNNREHFLSYCDLFQQASKSLCYLQRKGLNPGSELVFQIEDNRTFLITFWACLLGGILPVPLAIGNTQDQKSKVFNVWGFLKNPYLITDKGHLERLEQFAIAHGLQDEIREVFRKVILTDELIDNNSNLTPSFHRSLPQDLAFIQFSSGSTGAPKGVMLTHANLICNMESIAKAANYLDTDMMLSWMPLTHDMGLIGMHLNPLYSGMSQALIPTQMFVRRPGIWLDKASEHQATITSSPNFGYNYLLRHGKPAEREWDLSKLRIIYNGAEPISDELARNFNAEMAKYGLKKYAMCPVYGLAEATLAVTISALGDEINSICLERNQLNVSNKVSIAESSKKAVSFTNVGVPINNCFVKVVDNDNSTLEEEFIGNIQIKGENVTFGYYNNPSATQQAIAKDGWLNTGDLGFLRNGSLYVTGRSKDIFFINGTNYYPHDFERAADAVDGVELNKVVFAGWFNEQTEEDEVIGFVTFRGNIEKFAPLASKLRAHINSEMGVETHCILPVSSIPKTTSGKIQRYKLLQEYKNGDFKAVEYKLNEIFMNSEVLGEMPSTEAEIKITKIWEDILKRKPIGIEQNFFEIGGNSLKAAEVIMKFQEKFQVELPLDILYKAKNIKVIAKELNKLKKKAYESLPEAREMEYYPVSSAQRRIYFAAQMNPESVVYNIPTVFRFKGELNIGKLKYCLETLIRRNESLRTRFILKIEPVCVISDEVNLRLDVIDIAQEGAEKVIQNLIIPFDLSKEPLYRFSLLKSAEDDFYLFTDFHHLVSDGLSVSIFMNELIQLYSGNQLSESKVNYKDFVAWEQNRKPNEDSKSYWSNIYADGWPLLEIQTDFIRPVIRSTKGEKIEFDFDTKLTKKIHQLATKLEVTTHVLMYTFYNILLSKYTGEEDIIIGIPVSGRNHPDLQQAQGMFVNNLAIRNPIQRKDLFTTILSNASSNIKEALMHQDFLFDDLIQLERKTSDPGRNPVFDTMFLYQNMDMPASNEVNLNISRHFVDPGISKFDISLEIFAETDSIKYAFEYSTELFKKETILSLSRYFNGIIKSVLANPTIKICDLLLLSNDEYHEYIYDYNATTNTWPEVTILELFEAQAEKTPDAVAVKEGNLSISYQQLKEKSDNLAGILRIKEVSNNDIVGICLPASIDFIIGILGILKTGSCYLPIDIDLPVERKHYLISESKCKLVLSTENLVALQKDDQEGTEVCILRELLSQQNSHKKQIIKPKPEDLVYVIYTSGTTGRPKGVKITHKSLLNYMLWAKETYVKGEKTTFPLYSSISFDLTVTSIFLPLITGNRLLIYEDTGKELPVESVFRDNEVDIVKLTPSHLKLLMNHGLLTENSEIRKIIVGGEKFETSLAREVYSRMGKSVEIFNEYGPTEATIGCMISKFRPTQFYPNVPIGVPISNTQIYLLDEHLKPVPVYFSGEIYISGDGLATGYLFQDTLTSQRFIENPFVKGQKMYKTGDLARRLPDGNLDFTGRKDNQVKINGHRIELEEIENHILSYENVNQAFIIVKNNSSGQQHLHAYYTLENENYRAVNRSELRNHMARKLPHYMIPVAFIPVDVVPLTNNGKVDTIALAGMNPSQETVEALPASSTENLMLKIWKDVLGDENLTISDNFFELGGDSIKAVQISSRLNEEGILLSAKNILTYHTITQISLKAEKAGVNQYEQGLVEGERNLTPIESWFFEQRFQNPDYYNQSVLLRLHKKIDLGHLQLAFERIVAHHDGLRLNYNPEKNTVFYNSRHLNEHFVIETYQIASSSDNGTGLNEICEKIMSGFDITEKLLIKAAVIKEEGIAEWLFITAHHLVTDGVSWRILLEDFYRIYHALETDEDISLPQKTATSIDWEGALTSYSKSDQIRDEEEYWNSISEVDFSLPQDFKTEDWRIACRKIVSGKIDKEKTEFLLKGAHGSYNTDILILLNTALTITLKEWTGVERFVIELENHGRHDETVDTSRTVGWFTAMYPVIFELPDNNKVGDQIKAIKEQVRNIPNNGMGFGVGKYMAGWQDTNADELTEIRFNYLGQFDNELNNQLFSYGHEIDGIGIDRQNKITARLEFNVMIISGELNLKIYYNQKNYSESTIKSFRDSFFDNLERLLAHIKDEDELHFTPSDFDSVELDEDEINSLFQ